MRSIPLILKLSALGLLGLTSTGCGIGKALGGGKTSPDEFAIATKAPLVVPPDYSLRPPAPGEVRPQELSPSERAEKVLLGDASAAAPSSGEQILVQKAGALTSDTNIRAVLNSENGGRGDTDRSLANQLIFWDFGADGVNDERAPLKVDDPEEWMAQRQRVIDRAIGAEAEVKIEKSKTLNLPGVL